MPCLALPGEGNAPGADVRVVRHGARRGTPTPVNGCGCKAKRRQLAAVDRPQLLTWREPLRPLTSATQRKRRQLQRWMRCSKPDRLTNAHNSVQRMRRSLEGVQRQLQSNALFVCLFVRLFVSAEARRLLLGATADPARGDAARVHAGNHIAPPLAHVP